MPIFVDDFLTVWGSLAIGLAALSLVLAAVALWWTRKMD